MKKTLLLFLCLAAINAYAQTDLTTLVGKCSPSIFKVITYDASGNEYAVGTGFFVSSSGTALSNYHVFQGASKAKIKTSDGKTYLVDNVIGWSKESDMIKFTVKNELQEVFPYLRMNAVSPKQGEKIFIIGNPLGLEKSVADGIVSSVRQDDKMGETIQITAPISHGNSGSPLMDMNGDALGIVTYYLENGQNLNFAVSVKNLNILDPINALRFPPDNNTNIPVTTTNTDNSNNNNNSNSNSNTDDSDSDYSIDYDDPNSTFYYIDSKIKFCLDLDSYQQPLDPGSSFNISKTKGSWIYVWVGNNGKKLATDQIIVDIYRKKGKDYNDFVETVKYNITDTWPDTHFKYTFYKAGDYVFKMYTKNNVWIQDGYVTIGYK